MCKTCASTPSTPYLQGSVCASNCLESYYPDANGVCQSCSAECKTCVTQPTTCTSCRTTDASYRYKSGSTCVAECPSNAFADPNSVCVQCAASCKTCNGSTANNCTSCAIFDYLVRASPTSNYCSGSCPMVGYYIAGQTCERCPANCNSCQSSTACSECNHGFFQLDGLCSACSSNCGTCQSQSTNCLTCPAGKFLYPNSSCWDCNHLNESRVTSPINTCVTVVVPANCVAVTSQGVCTMCAASFTLSQTNNTCTACTGNHVFKQTSGPTPLCFDCDQSCLSCNGVDSNNCLTCDPLLKYLHQNQCLEECPTTAFFADQSRVCQPCHASCQTCSGPLATNCASCGANYPYMQGSSCVAACSQGFFLDTFTCTACHPSCKTCSNALGSGCTACKTDGSTVLKYLNNGYCTEACPSNRFADSQFVCQSCDSSCLTCRGPSSSDCLSCAAANTNHKYLHSFQCLASCPQTNLYPKDDGMGNFLCANCHSSCKSCTGGYPSECSSCETGLYLTSSSHCSACATGCTSCMGVTGSCEACAQGFVLANQACLACPAGCSSCGDPLSLGQCTECKTGYDLIDGSCIASCLPGCTDCANSVCSACSRGYYLAGLQCAACRSECQLRFMHRGWMVSVS